MLASGDSGEKFVKADTRNLPKLGHVSILEYIATSDMHNIAEIRGAKMLMSSRNSYLESAVGYVQVHRAANHCLVKAKIVPEHRISSKLYTVTAKIAEPGELIIDAKCDDCAAAAGGCKHALVLLFWLAKRSEEPSSTSVQCYWTKPTLSSARTEHLPSKNVFPKTKKPKLSPKDSCVLSEFLEESKRKDMKDSLIINICNENHVTYNLFDMTLMFIAQEKNQINHESTNFIQYADTQITEAVIKEINDKTINQNDSKYWHYIRQGRITASILHQAAHCKSDGALVQQILGGYKVPETTAIKRGRKLEKMVLQEVEKKLRHEIEKSGFVLINGIIGASPDGLTDDFVIEIKCPMTEKTFEAYVKNDVVQDKFKAQISCQMLACGKTKGLFCVADPSFERTKKVHIYWIDYDEGYTKDLIKNATLFWKMFIFPKLLASAKK